MVAILAGEPLFNMMVMGKVDRWPFLSSTSRGIEKHLV